MRTAMIFAAGALAALGGCYEREGKARGNEIAVNETAPEENEVGEERPARREADAQLLRDIRADLDEYRRGLPERSGPMTITDVELNGSELIYTQRSSINLTSEMVDRLEREVTRQVCRAATGDWIRRGVTMSYRISDPDGDNYRISISECPEDSGGDRNASARVEEEGSDSGQSSGGGSDLERQLARDVAEFRATLPQRDGPLTTYDVELRGTEIIYFQRTAMNLDEASFGRFERSMAQQLCSGQGTAEAIRRGATLSYRITDGEGEIFRTSVGSC